jgi:di/tricarboxylate transporter
MSNIVDDAKSEITGMAKQGMHHPSTKPVLIGGAIGGVAGMLLPILTVPVGLVVGAGYMFYKRLRP